MVNLSGSGTIKKLVLLEILRMLNLHKKLPLLTWMILFSEQKVVQNLRKMLMIGYFGIKAFQKN